MSYEKFKKAREQAVSGELEKKPMKPVSDKAPLAPIPTRVPVTTAEEVTLRREIQMLTDDIATLYAIIMDIDIETLEMPEIRTLINHFRMDMRHIIHRKNKEKYG